MKNKVICFDINFNAECAEVSQRATEGFYLSRRLSAKNFATLALKRKGEEKVK
jgi:protein-disulfide isomerase-like protein with CxxC motif